MKFIRAFFGPPKTKHCAFLWTAIVVFLSAAATSSQAPNPPVAITVHADEMRGELNPIWRFFGWKGEPLARQESGMSCF